MSMTIRNSWKGIAASGMGLGLLAVLIWMKGLSTDEMLLRDATDALGKKEFFLAEQLCQRILARSPDSIAARDLAASAAEKQGRLDVALSYLDVIRDDQTPGSAERHFRMGELAIGVGKLAAAESHFRRANAIRPEHVMTLRRICFLLRIEGRNWEAEEFLRTLTRLDQLGVDELFLRGTTEWVWLDGRESQFLDFCQKAVPQDRLPMLGRIRQSLLREEYHPALEYLTKLISDRPEIGEAQGRLGVALVQDSDGNEFLEWNRQLPTAAERHPGVWFARGLWLRKQHDSAAAIRCFGETLLRNPNHRGACNQLSQLLGLEGDTDQANVLAQRARWLATVEDLLREVQQSPAMMRELVETLIDLGRDFEAKAWLNEAASKRKEQTWINAARNRLTRRSGLDNLDPDLVAQPIGKFGWAAYPLPDWKKYGASKSPDFKMKPSKDASNISFDDVATKVGISFQYDNGCGLATGRAFMFEFSGGGVGVVDYDGDGWPDIYLSQGGGPPSHSLRKQHADKLFRNRGNGQFEDVTVGIGLENDRFGQGVTVGDYDNDGFPDLFVANIGSNAFFRNHGDGTFEDVTRETQTGGNEWSLSAALADFNGDSFPDLYVVNYLGGSNVFVRSCQANGRPVQCPPGGFPAEQDRLYLNLGDGHFRDITDEAGIRAANGKGMGIIVADFDGSRRPQIFIANDTTANFLFVNETKEPAGSLAFVDRAALRGVAYNDLGNARSSMGVACGDSNDDGRLDLLVTNYIREASSFLVQQPDQTFVEQTRDAGLRDPSLNKMGWGTQFLDADLDGHLDLAVANGHLDDYSASGVPFKMATQVFRNRGHARFIELPSKDLGPYFCKSVLGRAMARLDWNRDGRDDLAVTHVDAPFALLSNTTEISHHRLILTLRGVLGSRDAIGAVVRVQTGDGVVHRQLTAGDGFEASNERKIIVGMGTSDQASTVTIQWPSGNEQAISNLAADREWIIVEGRSPISVHQK